MNSYVIADLHLSQDEPIVEKKFLTFINDRIAGEIVYIIGDLFQYFIGLDESNETHLSVRDCVKKAISKGVKIFFIVGNRDFLLNYKCANFFGFTLLPNIYTLNLNKHKILLVHGDELCIENFSYKLFRLINRNRFLQFLFITFTTTNKRKEIAENLRKKSMQKFRENNYIKKDINHELTIKLANKYKCDVVIHGHTHDAKKENLSNLTIYDTGDWTDKKYSYIKITDNEEIELKLFID